MHRCLTCDKPIPQDRILAYLDTTGELPERCAECTTGKEPKIIGFMVMSGEHGVRKVGAELVMFNEANPTRFGWKELMRQANRGNRRSR